ncbi:MAG TPA: 16S rRNA (cytosine(1402)-N(4))-methyltransferase RsmH [Paracoccus sp. (in: a-proteobacteria)]|uniref:16S rRNA (cytosine(1402)-N(4))-methyltransferase RsmH n=1 Tax=uncultured Paracoccus sp. TaxID=189685 RepID=UPI0026246305|nr:16S rRNA (cytosine(1402)-N(4))-methyltransferase RsmH [uncultured Paracoccus sp.]HMQ41618.1 16S rRNA (cytosine(1402)-N(4))-methyltransferase RsmH [Paracoccus sp. (in: a-proteobacteria)]HMR35705.1 16S rRNA (cytosine(1402)-N(4))-methyltransferase RsmH [Paracoccus sp. (in: a-proteobacteria)]
MAAPETPIADPHIPVLIDPLIRAVEPVAGIWVDGTFGAGGYARRLLEAGAGTVIGIDRDPQVFDMAAAWAGDYGDRLRLVEGTFSDLDRLAGGPVDGVVLDLGVSSMQLDQAERGFSFLRDGPLDMRMGAEGPSAAELLNTASEAEIADVLYHYGEERASRRIARAIVAARPLETTAQLAEVVASQLPRAKPGQSHPATRSFQAIRIWVNDEFGQLAEGLAAAERALKPGGKLAVVSFHSLEDRVVKRFLQSRAATAGGGSRHAPAEAVDAPTFTQPHRRAIGADEAELAVNPRARSAFLRLGIRTEALARDLDRDAIALPRLPQKGGRR